VPEKPLDRSAKAKLVRAHIAAAIKDTDQAAIDLIQRLKAIERLTDEATEAAAVSARAVDELSETSSLSSAMREFRGHVERRFERSARARRTVGEIADEVRQLNEAIRTIRDLAEKNYLLSINASVEAARAGTEGSGFAVVAKEVREQASTSRVVADAIEDGVSAIDRRIKRDFDVSEEKIAEEQRVMSGMLDRIASLLESYESVHALQARALASVEEKNAELNAMLLRAIGVIQFQDVVRQKLEAIDPIIAQLEQGTDGTSIEDGYTMASQRQVHQQVVGEEDPPDDEPMIELF